MWHKEVRLMISMFRSLLSLYVHTNPTFAKDGDHLNENEDPSQVTSRKSRTPETFNSLQELFNISCPTANWCEDPLTVLL